MTGPPVAAAAGARRAARPRHMAAIVQQAVAAPVHRGKKTVRHRRCVARDRRRIKAGRSTALRQQQRGRRVLVELGAGSRGQRTRRVPIFRAQIAAAGAPLAIIDDDAEEKDRDEGGKDGDEVGGGGGGGGLAARPHAGQILVRLALGRQLVAGVGAVVLLVAHLGHADALFCHRALEFGLFITAELLVRPVLAVNDPIANLESKVYDLQKTPVSSVIFLLPCNLNLKIKCS